MKTNSDKYVLIIGGGSGIFLIIGSIMCRVWGKDGIWLIEGICFISVSLMENVGAALLIPPIFVLLKEIISWGLRPKRPLINVYLRKMKSYLKTLGISLHDINKNPKAFKAYLEKIFGKSKGHPLSFTFLLMNPSSRFLKLRAEVERKPFKNFLTEIETTLKCLKDIKNVTKYRENISFKVYIYDALPTHSLIWADGIMHVGWYFRGKAGYETFWIDISSGKKAYDELESDFNQLKEAETTKELIEDRDFDNVLQVIEELKSTYI